MPGAETVCRDVSCLRLMFKACKVLIRLSQLTNNMLQVQDLHTPPNAAALRGRPEAAGSRKLRQQHSAARRQGGPCSPCSDSPLFRLFAHCRYHLRDMLECNDCKHTFFCDSKVAMQYVMLVGRVAQQGKARSVFAATTGIPYIFSSADV